MKNSAPFSDLLLVRHASYSPSFEDPSEGLSLQGKKEASYLAELFKKLHLTFDCVYSSTKKRAIETTSILSSMAQELYSPSLSASELLHILPQDKSSILVVGHNPTLGEIANLLGYNLDFSPASAALFSKGQLKWLVTEQILRP